ncbi:MAG: hypothetical protein ACYC7L_05915 [Nitrospirota bacterium]
MERQSTIYYPAMFVAAAALLWSSAAFTGEMTEANYLYRLSTFTGTAAVGAWPKLTVDARANEVYVLTDEEVSIFNQRGMEIYRFTRYIDDRPDGRMIIDMAIKKSGGIVLLTQAYQKGTSSTALLDGNYRGEPVAPFVLKDLPADLSNFRPYRVIAHDGLLYLANLSEMKIVVVTEEGVYKRTYELLPLLRKRSVERAGKARPDDVEQEISDFSVDATGSILFTVPVVGEAYRLTPDLRLDRISTRGSGPGKFGIPASVIADKQGNYLVADMLRSVVMVFDRNLAYRGAFGGRHNGEDALAVPRNLVIDSNNRLYVSQTENMGVSVFQLTYN